VVTFGVHDPFQYLPTRSGYAADAIIASMHASEYTIFLAKNIKCQLIAMHSVQADEAYHYLTDLLIENIDKTTSGDSIVQTIKQDSDRWFNDIKQKCSASGVQVKTGIVVSTHSIEDTIVNYATSEGIDLIVMGTKAGKGLKKRMLGTTAFHVIKHTTCPVLVENKKSQSVL
jgi:nucleotide-binding universal stress UspA family protein